MSQDYNTTLNLPKTDFPMRAGLPTREPIFLEHLNEIKLYEKICEKNKNKKKYILHDGPPFSNGDIHTGTAMNKILKDFVTRYKAMSGFNAVFIPGWDNHGMPIESAIIKKNKLDRNKMSVSDFRRACHVFAQGFVDAHKEQFARLGVLADWDHPYTTMNPIFEAREVKVFGEMYKKGYIYRGLKPVYWCPHDETALAEAEIEYADSKCKSIYVSFKIKNDFGKLGKYCDLSKLHFIIWTTTTWTLPGNLAIALNEKEDYALVKTEDGNVYIIANELVKKTMAMGKIENYEIIATLKGAEFEKMTATHPFLDRESLVVLADYVTMDSGTGCVHTAPGHGADDYITGKRYGLDILVPVNDRGVMTADAGQFEGMYYEKANDAIFEHLQNTGALFAYEIIDHSYPHCWRCKSPIIFRATAQWFCSVDAFRDEAIAAAHKVTYSPAWGEDRIVSMITERSDWCISRQRNWGLPIPIFYCDTCKEPICNDTTIGAVSALYAAEGSNAWIDKSAEEILPKGYVCPLCGGTHFTQETDTLDGWFDSGSTHFAVLEANPELSWPADLYLEGPDQYRGWFQSSLLTAIGAGKGEAPYKNIVTHGWVVDGEGKKMSKSLGNTIEPKEIIKEYGADILRLWVASSDYRVDVRVSKEIFKQLSQMYLKVRNTAKYILGNLDGFNADELVEPKDMEDIDKWVLSKLNALVVRTTEAYENFEYHIVHHLVHNFCVVELSSFYLDVAKDRLYCEKKDSNLRKSAQSAMYMVLDTLVRILSPILAFTSDEIWQAMPHKSSDDAVHVMLNQMNGAYTNYELPRSEMEKWDLLVTLRDEVNLVLEAARSNKVLGKPLEAEVTLYTDGEFKNMFDNKEELLKTLFIVSKINIENKSGGKQSETLKGIGVEVTRATAEKCERCWVYSDTVGKDLEHPTLCARCAAVVK